MTASELTLKSVKEKAQVKNFRASDFLTQEQVEEVKESNAKGRKVGYTQIDAYIAEIIARFGYDTYLAWKSGDISEDMMVRYIRAERAREIGKVLPLETIIIGAMAGANNSTKSGQSPKSLKMAIKVLKKQEQKAKGEF